MSKNWREKLESQLEGKGITPESSESSTTTIIPRKTRITTEKLQKQIDQLKKDLKMLKQENIQEKIDLPEETYNNLWLISRSELSKWNKKSDSMLNSINQVITFFNIDLSKNPFKKLKEEK